MSRFLPLLAVAVFVGCDSTGLDSDAPPTLIAQAAFDLDADTFPENTARTSAAGANYANAAVRVGVVSAVVGANLALPLAATAEAARATPVVTDGVWTWDATADVFGTPVDLRLEASADGSDVTWRLISTRGGDDPGDSFTYVTATTSTDGQRGTWRLFHPDEAGPVLTASFDVRNLDDREITFAVPSGLDNGGSSVRYATDGDVKTFDWDDQPENDRALIEWDARSKAGSIEADTYNGGVRACWNAALNDVTC